MEERPKNKPILLLDMYGVIIKESKGYFIPYTYEHFDTKEHDRLTRAFREECLFTKAGNGEISSDEFLSRLGYPDPQEALSRRDCTEMTKVTLRKITDDCASCLYSDLEYKKHKGDNYTLYI